MAKIVISAIRSVSPLGAAPHTVRLHYESARSAIRPIEIGGEIVPAAQLAAEAEELRRALIAECPHYADLDRTVQLAILAARATFSAAGLPQNSAAVGISIGSSRGATQLLEQSFSAFARTGKVPTPTSPVTTPGNISSWVAQDLMTRGFEMSHSVTCSTGLHSLINAVAWIKSGLCAHVIAGASEAALTPFTIAQMKALRIYSRDLESPYPCRPLGVEASGALDGLVLGEGAAAAAIETDASALERGRNAAELIELAGFGFAMEPIESATGITENGVGFERAMRQAIAGFDSEEIDCVIAHAPGTAKGDHAELEAIGRVFPCGSPTIISNKWIIGHTFATAGMLNLELAEFLLTGMPPPDFPYPAAIKNTSDRPLRRIMINAAGFGGNAVSIVVRRYV